MCLANVTRRATEFTGFKFMTHCDATKTLYGQYHTAKMGGYQLNTWYSAHIGSNYSEMLTAADDSKYPYGFHIIPTARHALNYFNICVSSGSSLVRVTYRGVLAQGIDSTNCEVADAKIRSVVAAQIRFEEIIPHHAIQDYLTNLLPKPKRRSVTVAELGELLNNSHTLSVFEEKLNELLGYEFQQEVIKRAAKYAKYES